MAKNIKIQQLDPEKMISKQKTLQMLDMNKERLPKLMKSRGIRPYVYKNLYYYDKEDIEALVQQQNNFYKKYIFRQEIFQKYDISALPYKLTSLKEKEPIPLYISMRGHNSNPIYFDRKLVHDFFLNYFIFKKNISASTPFETYLIRLETIHDYPGFKQGSITHLTLIKYIKEDFQNHKSLNARGIDMLINRYVKYTTIISRYLHESNVDEIFNINSSNLSQFISSIDNEEYQLFLYRFINYILNFPSKYFQTKPV